MLELVHFTPAESDIVEQQHTTHTALSPTVPKVAIAIPAYNEERFIGSVVIQALCYSQNVVVIDDGSSDATTYIAERAGATVLRHVVNRGKSEAVNTALEWARDKGVDVLVFIDGDGQHSPDEIERVLAPVLAGQADMVIGSRFLTVKSHIPLYRKIGQHLFNIFTNVSSGVSVTDTQSGFRAFSRKAIECLRFKGTGLSVESEMQFLAREYGLAIVEVPISVVYAEKAKRNPFAHGMQILSNLVRLVSQHRPLLFFGVQGLLLLLAASYMSWITVDIFARTRVLAIGYAVISALLMILGVLTLFVGLILHSIRNFFTDLKKTIQRERSFREA